MICVIAIFSFRVVFSGGRGERAEQEKGAWFLNDHLKFRKMKAKRTEKEELDKKKTA